MASPGCAGIPGAAVRAAQVAGQATPPISYLGPAGSASVSSGSPRSGDYTPQPAHRRRFPHPQAHQARATAGSTSDGGQRALRLRLRRRCPTGGLGVRPAGFLAAAPHPARRPRRRHRSRPGDASGCGLREAAPMDLRFYHDGMGHGHVRRSSSKAWKSPTRIMSPASARPYGVARTDRADVLGARSDTADGRRACGPCRRRSPRRRCWSRRRSAPARGRCVRRRGAPADRSRSGEAADRGHARLPASTTTVKQVEQRRWYGFWDYGDVMHTYDHDRHVWRYDVGGYAWDNSELSPDLWLWYQLPAHRPMPTSSGSPRR